MISDTIRHLLNRLEEKEREVAELKERITAAINGSNYTPVTQNKFPLKYYVLKALKNADEDMLFDEIYTTAFELEGYHTDAKFPKRVLTQVMNALKKQQFVVQGEEGGYSLTPHGKKEASLID